MLIGNVGRDPSIRYFDGNEPSGPGRKVATFTLATSERYRTRSGDQAENTEWHNIVAWGQLADLAEKFISKGTQIYVEGRLRTRKWDDKSGITKYTTEIMADRIQLLGRRESNVDEGGYRPSYQQPVPQRPSYQPPTPAAAPINAPSPAPASFSAGTEDEGFDDLPF